MILMNLKHHLRGNYPICCERVRKQTLVPSELIYFTRDFQTLLGFKAKRQHREQLTG